MYKVYSITTTHYNQTQSRNDIPHVSDLTHTKEDALFIYFLMKVANIPARIEKLNDKMLG